MFTVRCIKDPLEYYADCIHKCIKGLGTNDQRLMELVVAHCEVGNPCKNSSSSVTKGWDEDGLQIVRYHTTQGVCAAFCRRALADLRSTECSKELKS